MTSAAHSENMQVLAHLDFEILRNQAVSLRVPLLKRASAFKSGQREERLSTPCLT